MSKQKIKAEDKMRIAKAYKQGKVSLLEGARQIGVHHTTRDITESALQAVRNLYR